MRVVLTTCVAVALSAGAGTSLAAEKTKSKLKQQLPPQAQAQKRIYDDRDKDRWYPRDSNQLRFGSQIWWEQMEREGRFRNLEP
jgi:hypothetical protein